MPATPATAAIPPSFVPVTFSVPAMFCRRTQSWATPAGEWEDSRLRGVLTGAARDPVSCPRHQNNQSGLVHPTRYGALPFHVRKLYSNRAQVGKFIAGRTHGDKGSDRGKVARQARLQGKIEERSIRLLVVQLLLVG